MQQLLDGVHSTGFTGLVLATGNLWGNDLRMIVNSPLNGRNVVYAAHSYPFYCNRVVYYQEAYNCNGTQYPPFLDTPIAPAIGHRAVMLSEFRPQRSIPRALRAPIDWAHAPHLGSARCVLGREARLAWMAVLRRATMPGCVPLGASKPGQVRTS